jgi:hypothetical protein
VKDQLCVRRHCHIGNYFCHTVQRVSKSRFDIHLAVQNAQFNACQKVGLTYTLLSRTVKTTSQVWSKKSGFCPAKPQPVWIVDQETIRQLVFRGMTGGA